MPDPSVTTHVVGIDIGMESCTMSCLTMDKRQVIKSTPFVNAVQGFDWLFERLEGLGVAPQQILVGLKPPRAMERICCRPCSSVATRSVCYIRPRCMPLLSNVGCERKRISWMRPPSHERCSVGKRASATYPVSRWRPTAN